MLNKINSYLLEAEDFEVFKNNTVIIVLENKRVLLTGLNLQFINECYEIFGEKFRKNNCRKKNHLRVSWLEEEIEYLKKNYQNLEVDEIGRKIDKSDYQIIFMLGKLQLITKKEWAKSEIEFLQSNIDKSTIWLAGKLRRSVASIKSKKRILKLSKI